jgi:hypothetical protein
MAFRWEQRMSDNIHPAQPSDDAEILSLFREWITAHRQLAAEPDDQQSDKLNDRIYELVAAITATPAAGAAGLAVKVYLSIHMQDTGLPIDCGEFSKDAAALSGDALGDVERHDDARLERAMLEDAVRFVPELAPLAANVINGVPPPPPPAPDYAPGFDLSGFSPAERRLAQKIMEILPFYYTAAGADAVPEVIGFGEPDER